MDASGEYSDQKFWEKVNTFFKEAGTEVVEKALWLYYVLEKPETPAWAKGIIIGALAYFIIPVDAIPDLLVGVGYTDDLGVLAAAVAIVAVHIDEDVKVKTRNKMKDWGWST